MKVLLFGASGMVGQGVLRECLLDPDVEQVISIVRALTGQHHAKLREIVHKDFLDYSSLEPALTGIDACIFCLGVASTGMQEEDYRRITYGFTLAAAEMLAKLNPAIRFIYVSGRGADSTEKGRVMWARVRGETENALLRLPIEAYVVRLGMILPMHGIQSKTWAYRFFYRLLRPVLLPLRAVFPKFITTTEEFGRVLLRIAKEGASERLLQGESLYRLRA